MRSKIAVMMFFILFTAHSAFCCVGKTIFVGYVDNKSEEIMGNIFSRLISERTGTTVKLKKFENAAALLQSTIAGEVDVFVFSDKQIKETSGSSDREKAKNDFNLKHNLVWLKPLAADANEFLAPVIRKDTLKKFPALPRLIEKLNGIVTTAKLNELTAVVQKKGMKDTIKDFLKEQSLI